MNRLRSLLGAPLIAPLTMFLVASLTAQETLLVRAQVVHTQARTETGLAEPLRNAVVLIQDGKITAIGAQSEIEVPADARVLEAAVVTPGLIDAHSVCGLAGWLGQDQDQDQLDSSEPLQPELRAIDAYNPRDPLLRWLLEFGVTTIHTGHAPGPVLGGQTLIAKTFGDTVAEVVMRPGVAVCATLSGQYGEAPKAPGTRPKAVALLRAELVRAAEYAANRERSASEQDSDSDSTPPPTPGARDLRLEALATVLSGERPLLVTAHRSQDIQTALRLQQEFGFRLWLDGAAEAHLLIEELKAADVPILLHAPMARATGELANASMESAALLSQAGLKIALQSGYENYVPKTRVVLFEAAIAARHGLDFSRALALITIGAAEILGIDERVGSLELGKDADLALYDGDPFEYATHCIGVLVDGKVASEVTR